MIVNLSLLSLPGIAPAFAGKPTPPAVKDVEVTVVGRYVEGDQEILAVKPVANVSEMYEGARIVLGQPAGRPTPWSAVMSDSMHGTVFVIRRQIPSAGEQQIATVYPPQSYDFPAAPVPLRFVVGDTSPTKADATLKPRWLRSLRDGVADSPDAWADAARFRIDQLLAATAAKREVARVRATWRRLRRPCKGSWRAAADHRS